MMDYNYILHENIGHATHKQRVIAEAFKYRIRVSVFHGETISLSSKEMKTPDSTRGKRKLK